jgi:hypothetical protein
MATMLERDGTVALFRHFGVKSYANTKAMELVSHRPGADG